MFITLEGIEAAGKSELSRWLGARLCLAGHAVRFTSEPGGTTLGADLRELLMPPEPERLVRPGNDDRQVFLRVEPTPLATTLLYAASRAQHTSYIQEWLANGEVVLCSRYSDSTWAYQGAEGIDPQVLRDIERLATRGLKPDITLLLDLPVETAIERVRRRSGLRRFDRRDVSLLETVRGRYLELAALEPTRIRVLDAALPIDRLCDSAWLEIQSIMREGVRTWPQSVRPIYRRQLSRSSSGKRSVARLTPIM